MNKDAKLELAKAINATHTIREESYEPGRGSERHTGKYTLSYTASAIRAGVEPDLIDLVVPMLQSGCMEFTDWAIDVLLADATS